LIALAGLSFSAAAQDVRNPKGVLDPENTLEARLNRLQPPDRVMDAIGVVPGMAVADIGAGALEHLKRRCERGGLGNVEAILGDPIALMRNVRPALRANGKLAIGEWIPKGEGTPPETMTAQMKAAGFVLERIDKLLEANGMNIYIFRPGDKD
jgi:hypothetical protein